MPAMKAHTLSPNARQGDIFDHIRDGCRFVASRAAHVHIREDRLKEYAISLSPRSPSNVLDDAHHFTSQDPETLATYILSLEAVNFGSGFEIDLINEGWPVQDNSLYFTVSTALKECFEQYGPRNAIIMRRIGVDSIRSIFKLPDGRFGNALAAMFTTSINEMGAFIEDEYDGSFMKMVQSAEGLAARLVGQLANLDGFRDVSNYQGRDIALYKRAQITAMDMHLAFGRIGKPLFGDLDRLTIFADNGLPHVLQVDGVLDLHPGLAAKISQGQFITAGSEEEIELRCCAVEAVERLAAIKGMRVADLDHILWHRSVEDPKYSTRPAHRTLTRFY